MALERRSDFFFCTKFGHVWADKERCLPLSPRTDLLTVQGNEDLGLQRGRCEDSFLISGLLRHATGVSLLGQNVYEASVPSSECPFVFIEWRER